MSRPFLLAGLWVLGAACGGTTGDDDDTVGDGEGEGEDPCADVVCPPRTSCEEGACVESDPCVGVSCDEGFVCSAGTCVNGALDEDGDGFAAAADCDDHDPDVVPGSTEPCTSDCGEGTTTCEAGEWLPCTAPEECECNPGETRPEPCGQCGVATRTCGAGGTWESEVGECGNEGECSPAAVEVAGCGSDCAQQSRTCADDCTWGAWDPCEGATECDPGAIDTRACGDCGGQDRTCTPQCLWGAYGACEGEGMCSVGATESRGCGNCGTESRTCDAQCSWGAYGRCANEGLCAPGAVETRACGPGSCGEETRTCSAQCGWGAFGLCAGQCTQLCGDITGDLVINYEDYEFCLGYFPFGDFDPETPCCMQYVIDTDLDGTPEESDCERIGAWWLQGAQRPPWQCG